MCVNVRAAAVQGETEGDGVRGGNRSWRQRRRGGQEEENEGPGGGERDAKREEDGKLPAARELG